MEGQEADRFTRDFINELRRLKKTEKKREEQKEFLRAIMSMTDRPLDPNTQSALIDRRINLRKPSLNRYDHSFS